MNQLCIYLKSIRNYFISMIVAFPWSRKLLNAVYLKLTPAQKSRFHQEFAKIFKYRSVRGRDGRWEVKFMDKPIHIPLTSERFWLDWDTALTVVGQDIEIRETYSSMINSSVKPDLFIDIGANYGTHSLLFLVHGIKTLSFEPNSSCHAYYRRLCDANQVVPTLEPVALGDQPGRVTLAYPKDETWLGSTDNDVTRKLAFTQELITEQVPQKTLDDYIEKIGNSRALIKIDTEGHELAVLRGAQRIIAEIKPIILYECWQNDQRKDMFNFLEANNYQICELPWSPVSKSQPLTSQQYVDNPSVNFIAIPHEIVKHGSHSLK